MQLSKVYLIEEGSNQEDSATGASQQIFFFSRIRQTLRFEPFALVSDRYNQGPSRIFHRHNDAFSRIVAVAVQHGIYGCFTDAHHHLERFVFVHSQGMDQFFRLFLHFGNALHGRGKLQANPFCFWLLQWIS